MNDTGWDKLTDAIDAKFGIADHGRHTEPLPDNPDLTQQVAWISFVKDGQTYKLERIARPAVIDRKTHYHKAATGGIRYENIYDPENTTFVSKLYNQDSAGEWMELDPSELSL
jgi:hypothetical protein